MSKKPCDRLPVLLISITALLMAGCASSYEKMIPQNFDVNNKHTQTLSVNVVGGWSAGFWNGFQLSNTDYTKALTASIEKSGVFQMAKDGQQGNYLLEVYLQNHSEPMIGLDVTISLGTEWIIKKPGTAAPLWQREISSACTVKVSEALVGMERFERARVGAVQKSIKNGIQALSESALIE